MALVDELLAFVDAKGLAVWIPSATNHDTLVVGLHRGLPSEYVTYGNQMSKLAIAKEKAPVYQSWREQAEVIVPKPSSSDRLPFKNWYETLGLCEIFTCPLVHERETVAVLALYYPEQGNSEYRFKRRHATFGLLCAQLAEHLSGTQAIYQQAAKELENA